MPYFNLLGKLIFQLKSYYDKNHEKQQINFAKY